MKHTLTLTITSLLSILVMTFHLTDDTLHAKVGTAQAGGSTLVAVPILVVWLYGTLVLAERRSGYVIMLVGSLLGLSMPVIHVMGAGGVFRGEIAKSSGAPSSRRADCGACNGASPGSRRTLDRPARSVMVRTRDICNPSRRIRHESFDKVKRA